MSDLPTLSTAAIFTTGQIARMSAVHINVVKKWINDGLLEAYRLPAGHYRITRQAYLSFLSANELPLPEELDAADLERRYLVIDDDPAQRSLLRELLSQRENCRVRCAADGYAGLIEVGAFQPDIVFLDIAMPRMDGFAMLSAMAQSAPQPQPKIIVVTGKRTKEIVQRIATFDVAATIFKPYSLQQVENLLSELG